MSDDIQAIREECECGHDKCSHYPRRFKLDDDGIVREYINKGPGKCLVRGCDKCYRYLYKLPK